MPLSQYELAAILTFKDKSGQGTKKAAKGMKALEVAAVAAGVAFGALKSAQAAVNFAKMGAAVERQGKAFENLAKAAGTTGSAILESIQKASNFTIDRMTAMKAANKAMIMEVAKTPEQFEELATVAVRLGQAMGLDAAKSIDDFIIAASRQSKVVADNLGITLSLEDAYRRFAEANDTSVDSMDDAQKKQASLNEMLRQGKEITGRLGEATLDNAGKFEAIESAMTDLANTAAVAFLNLITGSKETGEGLETLPKKLRAIDKAIQDFDDKPIIKVNDAIVETHKWVNPLMLAWRGLTWVVSAGAENQRKAVLAYEATKAAMEGNREVMLDPVWYDHGVAVGQTADAVKKFDFESKALSATMDILSGTMEGKEVEAFFKKAVLTTQQLFLMEKNTRAASAAMDILSGTMQGAEMGLEAVEVFDPVQIQKIKDFAFDATMAYTQYQKTVSNAAETYAERQAKVEKNHQDRIAEITQQGQSRTVRVDVKGERLKLKILKERLREALEARTKFDAIDEKLQILKNRETVRGLRASIAETTSLLEQGASGWVTIKGKNVDDLLAEANRQYADEKTKLAESRTEQERIQRESLGRMLLQQFETWANMTGVIEEQPEKYLKLRNQIATEYGLITEEAARAANLSMESWKLFFDGQSTSWVNINELAQRYFDNLEKRNGMEIDVRIRTIHENIGEQSSGAHIPEMTMQHGGFVGKSGVALVGEQGPEPVFLPRGSTVAPNRNTTIGSHNTYNVYDQGAASMFMSRDRQAARHAFARSAG
jgi:hypothetical protein